MRIACGLLGVLFLSFAVVQLNDPDPALWAAFYLVAAVICGLAALGRFLALPAALALLLFLGTALYLSPGFFKEPDWATVPEEWRDAKPRWLNVEEARESAGLLLASLAMGLVLWGARQRGRKTEDG